MIIFTLIVAFMAALYVERTFARAERGRLHTRLWLCIHRGEGAWNDSGYPYWGGLQMSSWFMRTYGWDLLRLKGTADHWTPVEQMTVAERGYRRSGYSTSWVHGQWPVSSRRCI